MALNIDHSLLNFSEQDLLRKLDLKIMAAGAVDVQESRILGGENGGAAAANQ